MYWTKVQCLYLPKLCTVGTALGRSLMGFVLLFLPDLLKGSYWYLVVITIKQLFLQPVYPSKCSALQSQGYGICSLRNLFHIPYGFAFTHINIFMLLLQEFHNLVSRTENYQYCFKW